MARPARARGNKGGKGLMRAVITVVGRDTVGVVARVSQVCAELNINIEDVTQSIMQEMFCMTMLVNLENCAQPMDEVRRRRDRVAAAMQMEPPLTREHVLHAKPPLWAGGGLNEQD